MKQKFTLLIFFIYLANISFVKSQVPATLPYNQDFTTNDFTFVNGNQTNKWVYGNATGNTGRSIYISNSNGTSHLYNRFITSLTHAYRDIAIPVGTTFATLSFDWRGNGQANNDFFRVWLVPANQALTAGVGITAGGGRIQVGGNFGQQNNWQNYSNINLNIGNFAGSTLRLVFEWRNNANTGNQPPAAIDNISFISNPPPAVLPYNQDFTTNDFTFVNGNQTNKWVYGNATGNTGRSIYISNSNGTSHNYNRFITSLTHAYRDIAIPVGTTIATLSFDWRGNGQANNDFFRVWLIPANQALTAGVGITAGGGRIQVGGNFGQQNNWQNYLNTNLNIGNFAGSTLRLVFEWRNNANTGNQPPAAIDNISLGICSDAIPVVAIGGITHNSATVTWPQDRGGASYTVRYRPVGTNTPWIIDNVPAVPIAQVNNSYDMVNLLPSTLYEVEVAAICNNVITNNFSHSEFTTRCDPSPPNFTINNITTNSALITWTPVPSTSQILRYRITGTGAAGWSPVINLPAAPANTFTLTNLNPAVTYEVQIANICDGTNVPGPWSNIKVFTTERTCEMSPTGLTITKLKPTTAEVIWDPYPGATYVLRYRKVGIPSWKNIPLSINTYTITGLAELTQYEMQVANVCNGILGEFTTLYLFTTPTVTYCPMTSQNANGEFISKVTVKPNGKPEMENTSIESTYTDYTADEDKLIELIQGSDKNEISIEKTASNDEGVAVWIDFDRSGTFDLDERILASPPSTATPVTTRFNVPADAFVSMTESKYVVMRVAMQRDAIPVNCTSFANGEVEDYTVRISKKAIPDNLNQDDILIYPNPVSSIMNVKNISTKANYKIYNSVGQLISEGVILNNKIDLSILPIGLYVIEIDDNGKSIQKKFIKQNK